MTLPSYLQKIPKNKLFYYLIAIVASLWFFNTAYIPQLSFVVGIAIALFYIYYKNESDLEDIGNLNIELHSKLNSLLLEENLPPPTYFHIEPDMINFFYSIRDYRVYNRDSYVKAIKVTNNLLRLRSELDNDYLYKTTPKQQSWQNFGYVKGSEIKTNIKNYKEIFELSEMLSKKAVNYIHSFVITLPSSVYKEKFHDSTNRFHLIIKRILDEIHAHCQKYSKNPLVGQDYGLAKPHHQNEPEAIRRFNYITI